MKCWKQIPLTGVVVFLSDTSDLTLCPDLFKDAWADAVRN